MKSHLLVKSYMTSAIYCCVISIIMFDSYKIPQFFWYLAESNCAYVAVVSIKMCLSINDIDKCVGEYKIARKVDIVAGLM